MAICKHCGIKIIKVGNRFVHVPIGLVAPQRACFNGSGMAAVQTSRGVNRVYFIDRAIERFWKRVRKTETCWLWQGYKRRHGYGTVMVGRKEHQVHRLAYTLLVGPIPKGLVLDHLCRNSSCVNPTHLEAVTQKENVRRGLRNKESRLKIEGERL